MKTLQKASFETDSLLLDTLFNTFTEEALQSLSDSSL